MSSVSKNLCDRCACRGSKCNVSYSRDLHGNIIKCKGYEEVECYTLDELNRPDEYDEDLSFMADQEHLESEFYEPDEDEDPSMWGEGY